jgi:predicted sulfurtransferase
MSLKKWIVIVAALIVLCLAAVTSASETKGEVERIGHEELKAMLGSAGLVILDVRTAADWEMGDTKIKGAIREDPKQIDEWFAKYLKDKTIVLYCS